MRVLVLNDSVTDAALPNETVERIGGAFTAQGELWVPHAPNLHDFDAFVLDMAKVEVRGQGEGERLTQQINELVGGGGVVVCFPPKAAMNLDWLPGGFATRQVMPGERVKLVDHSPFKEFLEPFIAEMRYDCDFTQTNTWQPTATTMAGFPVAGASQSNRVMILPRVRRPDRLVAQLFKTIVPQIIPERAARRETLVEEPPAWLPEIEVPGATELEGEIASTDQKLAELQQERDRKARELGRLTEYRGLLWHKGKEHLEPLVRAALDLLGVPYQKEEPRDLVYRGDGGPLYIEIEGSDNSIEVNKGRQLLGYIADSEDDDPASIKGAIIGNPFRQHPPDQRPPENRPLFSPQLQSLATKQGWPLITTKELFDLVCRHQTGDKQAAVELRQKLGLP